MSKRTTNEKRPRDFFGENNNCYKHGHNCRGKRSSEYEIWVGIRKRVDNPKCPAFSYYGGRGITYEESWRSFENFLKDVGEKPSKDHTLDRIDTNGNYEKNNVRWATRSEQSRNKRSNIKIEDLILKDWCALRKFNYKTVWRWLTKEGKSLEDVIKKGELLWGKEVIL